MAAEIAGMRWPGGAPSVTCCPSSGAKVGNDVALEAAAGQGLPHSKPRYRSTYRG